LRYPDAKAVAEMAFNVPKMYKVHSQKSKDIEVDLICIVVASDKVVHANQEEEIDGSDQDGGLLPPSDDILVDG
jgi:hypothetical protein